MPKGSISAFRDGFAQVKIFNAIPLPPFSAALNSAPQHPSLLLYPLFIFIQRSSKKSIAQRIYTVKTCYTTHGSLMPAGENSPLLVPIIDPTFADTAGI